MSVVFDSFTTVQSAPPATTIPNDGSWGPPSDRFLGVGGAATANISGETLSYTVLLGQFVVLRYLYPQPVDISNLTFIRLENVLSPGPHTYRLGIIDQTFATESVFAAENSGTVTWNLADFIAVDLTAVENISFTINSTVQTPTTGSFGPLVSGPIPCVAFGTEIQMADGTSKPIQQVKRGDIVVTLDGTSNVARLLVDKLGPNQNAKVVKMEKGSLNGLPNADLLITSKHPIIYQNSRIPARCFLRNPGISIVETENLPLNENDERCLYDLQFETNGSYMANGLVVQSRPPSSYISPLPKELYFNEGVETKEELPLVKKPVILKK